MRTREHVMPGMPIESADGTTIGTVKEVAGGYFKVDAPLHRDYWLPSELVSSRTATALQLGVDRSAAAGRRVAAPDGEAGRAHDGQVADAQEPVQTLRLSRDGGRTFESIRRNGHGFQRHTEGQASSQVQDRGLARYREAMREEAVRRRHRERVRRVAVITAGVVAAAVGAIAGYRLAAAR